MHHAAGQGRVILTYGDDTVPTPPRRSRSPASGREAAEAAFKKVTTKPVEAPARSAAVPGVRELVSLRIDQDVLEHFQSGGPGWQDRMNAALRKAAGL